MFAGDSVAVLGDAKHGRTKWKSSLAGKGDGIESISRDHTLRSNAHTVTIAVTMRQKA
jgi:hypothetical protein